MITHDPLIAQRAERRITLSDGRIVADDPVHQVSPVLG
jgi:predicted ABC-type transport system involved in lysophospholipase L1 biosynthesis ATPase subunit